VRGGRDIGTQGSRGHWDYDEDGYVVCVADDRREDGLRDHATKMQDIYFEVDRAMTEAWRNPPTR